MNIDSREVIRALESLKFSYPKDGFDKIFNLGIEAAVKRVTLLEDMEGVAVADALDDERLLTH